MKKITSAEEYIEKHDHFKDELTLLRNIILKTELEETIKWSSPVYILNGKNVIGLGAFKHHFGLWFFNGVFLKDEKKLLVNTQDGKTKALRQMRFENMDDIDNAAVLAYINEAIENQKLGKVLKPAKKTTKKTLKIPVLLQQALDKDNKLQAAFGSFTAYKQKEFAEYIDSAKRETTKRSRLEKITPMILNGVGLNDKYRKWLVIGDWKITPNVKNKKTVSTETVFNFLFVVELFFGWRIELGTHFHRNGRTVIF